jgi:putative ABC transport system permease protein
MTTVEILAGQLSRAARSLLRRPAMSLIALTTLALGIGANTAIFSIINVVLLKPLPFKDPDRLVMIWSSAPNQGLTEGFSSYPDFADWQRLSTSFDGLATFWFFPNGDVNLTGGTTPQRVPVARISPGFFEILGVAPLYGRTFLPEESIVGNHRRAILSYGLWNRAFGADPALLGRNVLVNGLPYEIVGIMPAQLQSRAVHALGTDVELWRPLVPEDKQTGGRDERKLRVIGRLANGVSASRAEGELSAIAARLAEIYPTTNRGTATRLVALREQVVRDVRRGLMFLLAAVGVVLLGACANVANLLLIKAASTHKQMALQHALGASRLRLSGEALAESVLLGGVGALLGAFLAFGGVKVFIALGPADIPLLSDAGIDGTVLAFTVVVTSLTVVLIGLVPAWRSSRPDVMDLLRQGGGQRHTRRDRRSMRLLTIAQIALAMILLTIGGLLVRSFQALLRVHPGLNSDRVLTFQLELPMATTYPTQVGRDAFFRLLLERVKKLSEIRGATFANAPPLAEGSDERSVFSFRRSGVDDDRNVRANLRIVGPDYFTLLGIPLVGRGIEVTDGRGAPMIAIVSETLARSIWGNSNPIGTRLNLPFGEHAEVVGIAGDVRMNGLDRDLSRTVYIPAFQWDYNFMTIIAKTRIDPQASAASMQKLVRELDPNVPLHHVRPLKDLLSMSVAEQRFRMLLVGAFSLLIFGLAVIGTYGVASYGVSERTSELGIRIALGASRGDIRDLILYQGLRLALAGIIVGGVVAATLSRVMSRFVFQISTLDVVTFTMVPLLLASATLVATYLPARRATRVDPVLAVRAD